MYKCCCVYHTVTEWMKECPVLDKWENRLLQYILYRDCRYYFKLTPFTELKLLARHDYISHPLRVTKYNISQPLYCTILTPPTYVVVPAVYLVGLYAMREVGAFQLNIRHSWQTWHVCTLWHLNVTFSPFLRRGWSWHTNIYQFHTHKWQFYIEIICLHL